MQLASALPRRILDVCLLVACANVLVKVYTISKLPKPSNIQHTYIGADYPEVWLTQIPRVAMPSDETVHFNLTSPEGIAQWAALVPGSGLVYLGQQQAPFTLSMFHQLQCLDVIRQDILKAGDGQEGGLHMLARHCLNYLRQMILCRGDLVLESLHDPVTGDLDRQGVYQCRDWTVVYDAVKSNQMEAQQ